ncbi:MAG: hypothetical protein ACRBBW_15780 [Cellvibrionaceae bacterium]
MEYEGYLTREEILDRVENAFPFVERPPENDLYVYDRSDGMRSIISSGISNFVEPELPYEGVMILYDEFSTISQKAVKWLFPSMLRILLKEKDLSGNLHWCVPAYFDHVDFSDPNSAYNFSWLSKSQLSVLNSVLEYISEKYGNSISHAQEKLSEIEKKI